MAGKVRNKFQPIGKARRIDLTRSIYLVACGALRGREVCIVRVAAVLCCANEGHDCVKVAGKADRSLVVGLCVYLPFVFVLSKSNSNTTKGKNTPFMRA